MAYSAEESSPVEHFESCCICDEEFSSDSELTNHLLDHANEEEFKSSLKKLEEKNASETANLNSSTLSNLLVKPASSTPQQPQNPPQQQQNPPQQQQNPLQQPQNPPQQLQNHLSNFKTTPQPPKPPQQLQKPPQPSLNPPQPPPSYQKNSKIFFTFHIVLMDFWMPFKEHFKNP
ncbi:uncharacterized protein TNIN_351501 [Trichonephila inaurata madagascariensis]|uniref:C2H2-type domain-containing protein n=1 Tax=Trichonephila inaurata madagascariensis TaxID=2747483 RepID=A0A8X7CJB2_9ARAC|nr:uncharacterized protein TNIN_351501 [Trichonephila inaurata madagascariensis]